jgi:hypothetical protein
MNSYNMTEMPGSLACGGAADLFVKHMDVSAWVLKPLDGETLSVGNSTAVTMTVPEGALWAKCQVTGSNEVNYTVDGTTPAPSSGTGFIVATLTAFYVYGDAMNDIQFLASSSETTKVYVEYYG